MERKVSIYLGTFQRRYGVKRALEIAKNIVGVDAVDFTLSHYYGSREGKRGELSNFAYEGGREAVIEYFSEIREYADSLGIKIVQTHGRGTGIFNDPIEDPLCLIDGAYDCLATKILGAKHCVMHAPPSYKLVGVSEEEQYELHYKMFSSLAPAAAENGVKIALETGGNSGRNYEIFGLFAHADHFIRASERFINNKDFKDLFCYCVDTGHSNMAAHHEGEPTVPDLVRRLGSAVEVLHINDNEGKTDMHATPMHVSHRLMGNLDVWDLMRSLDEIGYKGYYNLELGFNLYGKNFAIEEAIFAVKAMKNLLQTHYGEKQDGFIDDTEYLSEDFKRIQEAARLKKLDSKK